MICLLTVLVVGRDLRARLELAVERVSQLVKEQEQGQTQDSDYTSDSEDVSYLILSLVVLNN